MTRVNTQQMRNEAAVCDQQHVAEGCCEGDENGSCSCAVHEAGPPCASGRQGANAVARDNQCGATVLAHNGGREVPAAVQAEGHDVLVDTASGNAHDVAVAEKQSDCGFGSGHQPARSK